MWSLVSIFGLFVLIGLTIWCFVEPKSGSLAFFAAFFIFEGWLTILLRITKAPPLESNTPPLHLTEAELAYIRRNALVFRFPGTMRSFGMVLLFVAWVGFGLTIWFGFKRLWVEAVLVAANSGFLVFYLTERLDPINHYTTAIARGFYDHARELPLWESTWAKIHSARRDHRNST